MWRLDLNLRIIMDRVPLPMSHCFVVVASLQKGTVLPLWPQGPDSGGSLRWFWSSSAAFGCSDTIMGDRNLQSPVVNCMSKVFSPWNRTEFEMLGKFLIKWNSWHLHKGAWHHTRARSVGDFIRVSNRWGKSCFVFNFKNRNQLLFST